MSNRTAYSLLFVLIATSLPGCSVMPDPPFGARCGLSASTTQSLLSRPRGPVNGGFDENGDGKVDHHEAFTYWDFMQTERVIREGVEFQRYSWINVDTCYKFEMIAHNFYEDETQPILWQTCRDFTYTVYDPERNFIGGEQSKACRNFGTMEWLIL